MEMAKASKYSPAEKTPESLIKAVLAGKAELPKVMSRSEAVRWIEHGSRGRIFAADVTKRLGGRRTIVCRYGVKSHVKGVGLSFDPRAKRLTVVFDMQKHAYRMLNWNGLNSLLIDGKIHRVR
jgi:hypothetical protein